MGKMVSELRSKAPELQLQLQPFLSRRYMTLPELAGVLQVGKGLFIVWFVFLYQSKPISIKIRTFHLRNIPQKPSRRQFLPYIVG